ncbi:TPA: hypothetical protein KNG82_002198 [Escherichia coli]|nr:hypothetical protein [Escherichia coli]
MQSHTLNPFFASESVLGRLKSIFARGHKLPGCFLILPAVCDLLSAPIEYRTMMMLFTVLYTLAKGLVLQVQESL